MIDTGVAARPAPARSQARGAGGLPGQRGKRRDIRATLRWQDIKIARFAFDMLISCIVFRERNR